MPRQKHFSRGDSHLTAFIVLLILQPLILGESSQKTVTHQSSIIENDRTSTIYTKNENNEKKSIFIARLLETTKNGSKGEKRENNQKSSKSLLHTILNSKLAFFSLLVMICFCYFCCKNKRCFGLKNYILTRGLRGSEKEEKQEQKSDELGEFQYRASNSSQEFSARVTEALEVNKGDDSYRKSEKEVEYHSQNTEYSES